MPQQVKPPCIFVVNDDRTQLRSLGCVLEKGGYAVRLFEFGADLLTALDPAGPPALIVTDLYMPGLDGWRLCRLIRSPEYAAFNATPIVVMSATFSGEDARRITAQLGANAFLALPVDPSVLLEQVSGVLSGRECVVPVHMLVVEDTRIQTRVLEHAFREYGYEVHTAENGAEARAAFERYTPSVVVLDYHLPDVEGDVLMREFLDIRRDTVCIMITADPTPELAVSWMKDGAAAYVRKPLDPVYVLQLCEEARRERGLLRVVDLLEERTQQIRHALERSRRQQEAVAAIAVSPAFTSGDIGQITGPITERGAQAINVDRVGVWLLDKQTRDLCCVDLYEVPLGRHSSGVRLTPEEYGKEFDALEAGHYVAVDDALTDPRVAGYRDRYIRPQEISSILDVLIRIQGRTLGEVSFEQVGRKHLWQPDEIAFACRLADQMAMALLSRDRVRMEKRMSCINRGLLDLGTDFKRNINAITALAGELLGGCCALYNRMGAGLLCAMGQWQTPPDFPGEDAPEGHLCYDVIRRVTHDILVVPDLLSTPYADSDPNVRRYGLKSYIGHVVRRGGEAVGSLCVVYQEPFIPDDEDRWILGLLASAIGGEENRRQAERALMESERGFRELFVNAVSAVVLHEMIFDEHGRPVDYVFLDANPAFETHTGLLVADVLGERATRVLPGIEKTELIETYGQVVRTGKAVSFDHYFETLNRHYHIHAYGVGGNRFAVVFMDITERVRAEEKLKKAVEELRMVNRLMMGREERVLELKRDINELLHELGRPPKFQTTA